MKPILGLRAQFLDVLISQIHFYLDIDFGALYSLSMPSNFLLFSFLLAFARRLG